MKVLLIVLLASSVATPALAQHAGHPTPASAAQVQPEPTSVPTTDPHAGHGMQMPAPVVPSSPAAGHAGHSMGTVGDAAATPPAMPPPAAALSGPVHAADTLFDPSAMAAAREQLRTEVGAIRAYRVLVDRAEVRLHDGRDAYLWDAQGWYGGDIDKLWIKTEGEGSFGRKAEQAELQALWSHAITPWFDLQGGLRYDVRPEPARGHLVVGLQGLVPYMFEIDAAGFVSDEGDVTARAEAEYDLLITQRLILQPRAEINLAAQEVPELGLGRGINNAGLGLRLRYEFAREFGPYVWVSWERKFGQTADFAREEGASVSDVFFIAGLRLWF